MKGNEGILYAPDGGGAGDGTSGDTQAPPAGGSPKTFTQEEVDRFVAERAKHAKSSALTDLLGELGFTKADDLKATIAKQRETEAASKTDLEKAQAALAELEKRAADAERGRKQALLEKAVIAKAGALRFNNAEDAIRFLDPEKLEIGDDGQVIGLEDALKAIAKDRPYLLQQPGQVGATNPGRGQVEGETAAQKRARLWGAGDIDPLRVNGGVVWPNKQ